jgi:hypothetical protein
METKFVELEDHQATTQMSTILIVGSARMVFKRPAAMSNRLTNMEAMLANPMEKVNTEEDMDMPEIKLIFNAVL